jgi:hypothetical protein
MKICNICKKELSPESFGKRSDLPDGAQRECRNCNKIRSTKRYVRLKATYQERMQLRATILKVCSKCKKELPHKSFYVDPGRLDGLFDWCRTCEAVYKQQKRNNHFAQGLCKYCANPIASEYSKYCHRCWCRISLTYSPGPVRKKRVAQYKPSKNSMAILQKEVIQKSSDTTICPYTGEALIPGFNKSLDHKLPSSRFPELVFDINNLQWVSTRYNKCKNDLTDDEFLDLCIAVINNAAEKDPTTLPSAS